MTGFEYIAESIEIFEAALDSGIPERQIHTVAALAEKTGYSVYHFARLFSAVVGVNPKEYMRGRILSRAAERIARSDASLAVIAAEAGFADYETFSRAFRSRFGVPPRRIRELHDIPFACEPRAVPRAKPGRLALRSPEPDLVHEGAIHLAGMFFYMEDGERSFHRPWAAFMQAQSRIVGRKDRARFYQYAAWSPVGEPAGLSILCSVETADEGPQEPLFTARSLPPSDYLRFVHEGGPEGLHETYEYIYGDWFVRHDARPESSWEFQRYAEDGSTTEICIPFPRGVGTE